MYKTAESNEPVRCSICLGDLQTSPYDDERGFLITYCEHQANYAHVSCAFTALGYRTQTCTCYCNKRTTQEIDLDISLTRLLKLVFIAQGDYSALLCAIRALNGEHKINLFIKLAAAKSAADLQAAIEILITSTPRINLVLYPEEVWKPLQPIVFTSILFDMLIILNFKNSRMPTPSSIAELITMLGNHRSKLGFTQLLSSVVAPSASLETTFGQLNSLTENLGLVYPTPLMSTFSVDNLIDQLKKYQQRLSALPTEEDTDEDHFHFPLRANRGLHEILIHRHTEVFTRSIIRLGTAHFINWLIATGVDVAEFAHHGRRHEIATADWMSSAYIKCWIIYFGLFMYHHSQGLPTRVELTTPMIIILSLFLLLIYFTLFIFY